MGVEQTRPHLNLPTWLLHKLGLWQLCESLLWSRDLPPSPRSCAPEHPEADPNFNTESGAHGHFGSAVWHSASTT